MTKQTGEACTDIDRVYAEAPYGMCKILNGDGRS